jgi:hypothetical protein
LYCVTCKKSDFDVSTVCIGNRNYEITDHNYEVLSHDFITKLISEKEKGLIDGMILLINGFEYKCPFERVVTLKFDGTVVKTKSGTVVKYEMTGCEKGMYDFIINEKGYFKSKFRYDKVDSDSDAVIDIIKNHLVVVRDLEKLIVMRKKRKYILPDYEVGINIVDQLKDKRVLANVAICNSKASLIYMKHFISSVRDKDFFANIGNTFSVVKNNRKKKEYYILAGVIKKRYYRDRTEKWIFKEYDVTSEWQPGSVAFFLNEPIKIDCLVRDVPGFGFKEIVYLKKSS